MLTLQTVPTRAPSRLQAAPSTISPWAASSAEKQQRSEGTKTRVAGGFWDRATAIRLWSDSGWLQLGSSWAFHPHLAINPGPLTPYQHPSPLNVVALKSTYRSADIQGIEVALEVK